jgi:hypothetical protein
LKKNGFGEVARDDIGRPLIKLRKHDYEFGWFNIIAARHGIASAEVQQATRIADEMGQYYFPGMVVEEESAAPRGIASGIGHRTPKELL